MSRNVISLSLKKCWGFCFSEHTLTMSDFSMMFPKYAIFYVVIHTHLLLQPLLRFYVLKSTPPQSFQIVDPIASVA